jgi:hypothetical protein
VGSITVHLSLCRGCCDFRRDLPRFSGFVSSRASVLTFGLARGQLRILHDVERNEGRLGEAGAAKGSGDDLIVTATRAKKIAEFAVFSTEAPGGIMAFEASHTSDPALDAAMVLFKTIVQIGALPVPHGLARHDANRSGVGAMTVCRDPVRSKAPGRPGRAEEGLGRLPAEYYEGDDVRLADKFGSGRHCCARWTAARSPGSGTAGSLEL